MNELVLISSVAELADRAVACLDAVGWDRGVLVGKPEQAATLDPRFAALPVVANAADIGSAIAVVAVLHQDGPALSRSLAGLAELENATVLALETTHYWRRRPLLIQSIPKSGTHLALECAKAFGYQAPPIPELPRPGERLLAGHYYNLQHVTADWLGDAYRHNEFLLQAMARAPIVMTVRDPRDIAVSLAHYLAKQADYHLLAAHMRSLSPEQRLADTIDGNYPLPLYINEGFRFRGNIRQLCETYRDWWTDLWPNVWTVRYEDLIGPEGGSTVADQLRALWGLQLALHVPGRPEDFCGKVFNRKSPTFREATIGGHIREFTSAHHEALAAQGLDYARSMGYADRWNVHASFTIEVANAEIAAVLRRELVNRAVGCAGFTIAQDNDRSWQVTVIAASGGAPKRIPSLSPQPTLAVELLNYLTEARIVSRQDGPRLEPPNRVFIGEVAPDQPDLFRDLPVAVSPVPFATYKGFDLLRDHGRRHGRIIAVRLGHGEVNVSMAEKDLWRLHSRRDILLGESVGEITARIDIEELATGKNTNAARPDLANGKPIIVGEYRGFNLVAFRGGIYAVRRSVGAVDLTIPEEELRQYFSANDLAITQSVDDAKAAIDLAESRRLIEGLSAKLPGIEGQISAVAEEVANLSVHMSGLGQKLADSEHAHHDSINRVENQIVAAGERLNAVEHAGVATEQMGNAVRINVDGLRHTVEQLATEVGRLDLHFRSHLDGMDAQWDARLQRVDSEAAAMGETLGRLRVAVEVLETTLATVRGKWVWRHFLEKR